MENLTISLSYYDATVLRSGTPVNSAVVVKYLIDNLPGHTSYRRHAVQNASHIEIAIIIEGQTGYLHNSVEYPARQNTGGRTFEINILSFAADVTKAGLLYRTAPIRLSSFPLRCCSTAFCYADLKVPQRTVPCRPESTSKVWHGSGIRPLPFAG